METVWTLREKERKIELTNLIEIRIIELNKVKEYYLKNREDKKAQWIMFIEDPESREVQSIMEENEEIKEAVVRVHEMSEDEKMQRIAFLKEKAIMDEKSSYNTGLHKGIKKSKIEIAKRLLQLNVSMEIIMSSTGLSKEEILKLK